jgi:single-strand DNA-binding protein
MFHTIVMVGNLGRDPEMKYTPSGQAVCNFSVATSREYTANNEKVKETTWFRVTTWGKQAEVCNQYLKKGAKVLVEGTLTPDKATGAPRIWNNKEGQAQSSFEVNASTVRFLSSAGGEKPAAPADAIDGEEFPF